MDAATFNSHFLLRKDITYLNFGSFGACPKPIMEDYIRWHYEMEAGPHQFMIMNSPRYLKESRDALGAFIGCDGDDIVFTMNPSYAFNIIAKSLKLNPGDEILTTNLEYGAMDKTWKYYCKKSMAGYIRQPITLPIHSKEEMIAQFWKGYSNKTKAIFISHITSSTGLILPVMEICQRAKELGLLTIVDGAHVPGHIPLDLNMLKADIYTGACHKWMMTPKGSSFLYVKKEFQDLFDPLVLSWGYESATPSSSRFIDYHELQGTRDYSAFLTIPVAIRFMEENQWPKHSARCHELALEYGQRLCILLNAEPLAPLTRDFYGQLFSVLINTHDPEKLQTMLFEKYQVLVPLMKHDEKIFLRISVQVFNTRNDLNKLMEALQEIISTTNLIKV